MTSFYPLSFPHGNGLPSYNALLYAKYIMELIDFTGRCYDRQQLKVLFPSGLFAFQKDSIRAQMISLRLPNQ